MYAFRTTGTLQRKPAVTGGFYKGQLLRSCDDFVDADNSAPQLMICRPHTTHIFRYFHGVKADLVIYLW